MDLKIGLIRTLLDRAYKICSSWKLFHVEIEKIVKMLSYNGYSRNLTYSFINKEINKKINPTEKIIYEGPRKCKVYLKLPYIGDVSL